MNARGHDSGFTLIELIVVMAVFSLVAVMSLLAISGTLRTRDRLVVTEQANAEMTLAIDLLRRDLQGMLPVAFSPPGGGATQSSLRVAEDGALQFSAGGQPLMPDDETDGFVRIIWQVDRQTAQLTRQVWPVLDPFSDTSVGPLTVLMAGVEDLAVQSFWPDRGWQNGDGAASGAGYNTALPEAVEVTLASRTHGRLSVVVTLR